MRSFRCGCAGVRAPRPAIAPRVRVSIATLDNKRNLIAGCGPVAAQLLADSCRGVLVIWDLFPPWRPKGAKPCRREDRRQIQDSLRQSGVKANQVALICIQEELEAWLLADGRALSAVLSSPAHPARVSDVRRPDQVRNPKKHLGRLFKRHTGTLYTDRYHAIQIVRNLPDLNRLRRVPAFARFESKVTQWSYRQHHRASGSV